MITGYGFKDAISGFFGFPTDNARRILPAGLEPAALHHGTNILAVTVFDFDESEIWMRQGQQLFEPLTRLDAKPPARASAGGGRAGAV